MSSITAILTSFTVGEPLVHQNFAVFPLLGGNAAEPPYLTLKEALDAGTVTVAEVSEGGRVPQLNLENRGMKPVLIIDGEEVVGAKQNRILNITVLAPAGKATVIAVSCVEQGRWDYRSRHFEDRGRILFSKARAAKAEKVSHSKVNFGRSDGDQGQVWQQIAEKMGTMGVNSPSMAMEDIYVSNAPRMEEYVNAIRPVAGQAGAIFAINGRLEGMELFTYGATMARLLPKLVRGYAIDALEVFGGPVAAPARAEAESFLRQVAEAPVAVFPAAGLGEDLRIQSPGLAGGALLEDGAVLHLCAFRVAEESKPQSHDDGGTIRRRRSRE